MNENQLTFDEEKLKKLSGLLEESICIYRSDRDRAIAHYDDLKRQLANILNGPFEMSEEAALERECNKALKLCFESSKRLDDVIKHVTDVIMTQLNNETREKVAKQLAGSGGGFPSKPVNFNQLKNSRGGQPEIEYDEED